MLEIFAFESLPIFKASDNFIDVIKDHLKRIKENDILVIAHTIISRLEQREIKLDSVSPSLFALNFAKSSDKDPRIVEVVLQNSKTIVRMSESLIISETEHGFICANAGIDSSNATPNHVIALPIDPDKSARTIQKQIYEKTGKIVGIIISDTFGRVFRKGTTNFAIGVAGFSPIISYKGDRDLFGYELKTSEVCVADELAAASGLVMGQSNEGNPIIVIRGYNNKKFQIQLEKHQNNISIVPRKRHESLFW